MKIGASTRLPGFEPGAPISSSRSPFSNDGGVDGSQPGHRIPGNLAIEVLTGRGRKSGRHCLDHVTNFPGRHGVEFNKYVLLGDASLSVRRPRSDRIAGRVVGSLIYSLLRAVLAVWVTRRTYQAKLHAERLVLLRQVQVVERQITRVQWKPADRMLLAALRGTQSE